MTERWRRELSKVRSIGPSEDLLRRAKEGPRLPPRRPTGPERMVAALVALLVFAAGGIGLWRWLSPPAEPRETPVERGTPGGYYLLLPEEPVTALNNPNGGVTLTVETNLPDGTRVESQHVVFGPDPDGPDSSEGMGCCGTVRDGTVTVTVDNSSCYNLFGAIGNSAGFEVTLIVAPEASVFPHGLVPDWPGGEEQQEERPHQPAEVTAVLGERFENLTGEQVTKEGKDHVLRVSGTYVWPSDSCVGRTESFVPQECPATESQMQGDNLREAMGEVVGAVNQQRLCDLWQLGLTPAAEERHPWPGFRQEWLDWYERVGSLVAEGESHESDLEWTVVEQAGDRYELEFTLHGELVARMTVLALPGWPGAEKPGVVPFWGVDDYELL